MEKENMVFGYTSREVNDFFYRAILFHKPLTSNTFSGRILNYSYR